MEDADLKWPGEFMEKTCGLSIESEGETIMKYAAMIRD